jgi:C4-type Zn-finger protein
MFSCSHHVIQVLKSLYLPHVKKVSMKNISCSYCARTAHYHFYPALPGSKTPASKLGVIVEV